MDALEELKKLAAENEKLRAENMALRDLFARCETQMEHLQAGIARLGESLDGLNRSAAGLLQ